MGDMGAPMTTCPGEVAKPLTSVDCPGVPESFRAAVEELPDAPAIRCGVEEVSYAELSAEVGRIVDTLGQWSSGHPRVLVIGGAPSVPLVATALAVLTVGSALALLDPTLPELRRREIERSLGVDGETLSVPDRNGRGVQIGAGFVAASDKLPDGFGDDTSHIFFSSGTTGSPKAVLGSAKLLREFLEWERGALRVGPGDRVAMTTSVSFDVVLRDVLLPLTSGATLVIPPGPLPPDDMLSWLAGSGITVLHAVPTLASHWLASAPGDDGVPALRATLFAGEPLPPALVGLWRRAAPGSQVWNLYGPTETVLAKAAYRVPERLPEASVLPVGHAIPGSQVLVLDPGRQPCPPGTAGEIAVRFSAGSFGYLGASDTDRERFVPRNPGSPDGDWLYLTGDRGRADVSGLVEFLGRADNVVKVRGVRVDLDEVEALLAEHGDVRAACVVSTGAGSDPLLVGHVVGTPDADRESLPHRLVDFLRSRLPAPMVPNSVVRHDRMPVTSNGKVDRAALRDHVPPSAGFAAPETAEEEKVSRIWAEVLGLGRVGRTDDFFDLGGHSLTAARMLSLVRKTLGTEVPLTTLLERPRLDEFAEAVARTAGAGDRGL